MVIFHDFSILLVGHTVLNHILIQAYGIVFIILLAFMLHVLYLIVLNLGNNLNFPPKHVTLFAKNSKLDLLL